MASRFSEQNFGLKGDEFFKKYAVYVVRKGDYENYWNTIVIKNDTIKRILFAIKAFNVEISQVRDRTSHDSLAQIRLQFWSDAINSIFSEKTVPFLGQNEPILHEIYECNNVLKQKLSKKWFLKMVEARKSSYGLGNFPFTSINEYLSYCDSTYLAANFLINEALVYYYKDSSKSKTIVVLDHIAGHLAKSQGLANLVRGVVHNAQRGRCYIPSELLAKYQVTHQDFLRTKNNQKVRDVCYEIASLSHQHLGTAKKLTKDNSLTKYYPALLPIINLERFLSRLRKNDFDLLRPTWGRNDPFLPISLLLRARLWRIFKI